ncbi:hypothetical protein DTO166G4_5824 [Paecilomyces variotii]|nr:hypothetical protein DTO166G4_5824 [Paecilomyces variotii]KAJ9228189.1 hypothetical protein DTO166G5_8782 [Paecilomyces variotii]KAJ9252706.1 hypothetical protein DTO195F2_7355 [Paecilomyces variotii]KAJ9304843.1 hypothetical protein DTO217A2_5652 [Paecilomyces variotii]KAJ9362822.1 hypothetical protein DTO280E4_3171 [Paecilomyces variotii]
MESSHDACYAFLSPWHKSGSHNTASINGRHQEDPDDVWELVKSTHAGVKSDSVLRRNGKAVWPAENELEAAPETGYGHL